MLRTRTLTRWQRVLIAVPLVATLVMVTLAQLLPAPGSAAAERLPTIALSVAALVSAIVLLVVDRVYRWTAFIAFGALGLMLCAVAAWFAVEIPNGAGPTTAWPSGLLFLPFLAPILVAARAEYRAHFPRQERREVVADIVLVAGSLAALAYLFIRPDHATQGQAITAATVALVAAAQFALFGSLALWIPSRDHLADAACFMLGAVAICRFGWEWTRGVEAVGSPVVDVGAALAMLGLAASAAFLYDGLSAGRSVRLARPLLTSGAVVTACIALVGVALMQHTKALPAAQAAVIVAALGVGVAGRIVVSQRRTAQAHGETQAALEEKERALREADGALSRVRDANETLRLSEEHLRLVFDAAVDGIVELDDRDTVLRANDAFCSMVGLERHTVEGEPWTALAAAIAGVDEGFAGLPTTGVGTLQRADGQPLYLESRISDIPMDPPRRLLLVRDVTAGRVADQTIRSLFQFLQDRDEDRTRLLRRTNAAIEAERNRVARDLHDGPVQGVSAASLSLEAALLMIKAGDLQRGTEVLTKIRKELAEEADSLRALMSGLRPPVLEERGLIPALRETLARFGADHEVATEFAGSMARPLPRDLETLAYRIVQEALSNAGKHAGAGHVSVSVESDTAQLRIEIEDDGAGFDSAKAREYLHEGRVGLASMRERVELASGSFVIRSTPGRGTTILATLPVETSPGVRELVVGEAS